MASKKRTGGTVFTHSGNLLGYGFNWIDPKGSDNSHRWRFKTDHEANEANRLKLRELLKEIAFEIERGIFRPCERYPEQKIASFCRCPNCLVATPLANAHLAPRTLGELKEQYIKHEKARSEGDSKEIEASSYKAKLKLWRALEREVIFRHDGGTFQLDPLTDYEIGELSPEAVKQWLRAFQNRKDERFVATKYLQNMLSEIELALKFGQFRRYWSRHALLDFSGTFLKSTKLELAEAKNKSIAKPFSAEDRDRIINYYRQRWIETSPTFYKGKERIRLEIQFHYVVIAFNTGLRSPSEMTALEWSDVDFSRRELSVTKSRESTGRVDEQIIRPYTKNIKNRRVPLNEAATESLRALKKYRQDSEDWIFWNPRAGKNNPLALENGWAPLTGEKRIRYAFNQALEALKIQGDSSPYAMRHTFTTLLLDHTNFSDSKVAALIGDNVDTMKKHYAGLCVNRWRDEDDLNEMDKLNSLGKSSFLKRVE